MMPLSKKSRSGRTARARTAATRQCLSSATNGCGVRLELLTCGQVTEVWKFSGKDLNEGIDAAFDFETRFKLRRERVDKWVKQMERFYANIIRRMGCEAQIMLVFEGRVNPDQVSDEEMLAFEELIKSKRNK